MKITKEYIKKLIIEQIKELKDEDPSPPGQKMTSSDFKKQAVKSATGTQTGLDDAERQMLTNVTEKLKKFASQKNLKSAGKVTRLLDMLNTELDKQIK